MFRAFRSVRSDERRETTVAFLTLFGLIASHAILETARDALFLADIPASRLPWVYLAVAVVSFALTGSRIGRTAGTGGPVCLGLFIAGVVTAVLWMLLPLLGSAGLYTLYVWSGILTTFVLIRFWTVLSDLFTVAQAKRLYAVIGTGSVLGAIAGSATARALAEVMEPRDLLLTSGAGLTLTSIVSVALRPAEGATEEARKEPRSLPGFWENTSYVRRQPYARHVALLVLTSTVGLTIADYLFKSTAAERVPAAQLGAFFATVYLVLNVLSFATQLGLVRWLLARFDLSVALSILPAMLIGGSLAMIASGGIIAALLIKGPDGALRYSLHRTGSELLFVPMNDRVRPRVKAFIDIAGQKGGQALASLAILGALAVGASTATLAAALVVVTAGWLTLAISIQRSYLEVVRRRLRRRGVDNIERFPELDMASLETLVASLDSGDDGVVLAALDVLESEGKARLVPGLILYHPSAAVVERALTLFTRTRRANVAGIAGRLLRHSSPRVRSAAVLTRTVLKPDPEILQSFWRTEQSPAVRATAAVLMIAEGAIDPDEAHRVLQDLTESGPSDAKLALAEAVALRGARGLEEVLLDLAQDTDADVRMAALEAMGAVPHEHFLPGLVAALGDERTRPLARRVLVEGGDQSLGFLEEAFFDPELPRVIRWQLPKTISRFSAEKAAAVLVDRLPEEKDGLVRYRIIRALEALVREDPALVLDRDMLNRAIEGTLSRAYRYLDRKLALHKGTEETPARATHGHRLLAQMLYDKEQHAVGRLFRLLGLTFRNEDFTRIYRGLTSGNRQQHATSVELLDNVLRPPLRGAVLGLVDELPDEERLERGTHFHPPKRKDYAGLLDELLASSSSILRDLAVFHIGELRLTEFRDRLAAMQSTGLKSSDGSRTLALLAEGEPTEAVAAGASS